MICIIAQHIGILDRFERENSRFPVKKREYLDVTLNLRYVLILLKIHRLFFHDLSRNYDFAILDLCVSLFRYTLIERLRLFCLVFLVDLYHDNRRKSKQNVCLTILTNYKNNIKIYSSDANLGFLSSILLLEIF